MLVTLSGIVILVNDLQYSNAEYHMIITLLGKGGDEGPCWT